mgnify:CR=1 FL=1
MVIKVKNIKVAPRDHPIYTGKHQSYSVKTKPTIKKEIQKKNDTKKK